MHRAAVIGATGYAGAEVLRLLLAHPSVDVACMVGRSHAGEQLACAVPSLAGLTSATLVAFDADVVARACDVAFCALPHGASAPIVRELRDRGVVTFDLSADFRLRDLATYSAWYGQHVAPALVASAVYGLVELYRDEIRQADLVAVPGCYPTATILALAPLLRERLVDTKGIVVDAKSGVSGAGRELTQTTHYPEATEGVRAYKVGGLHRHIPEIEQELGRIAASDVRIAFTPHLVPMSRGIHATVYARAAGDEVTAAACAEAARSLYRDCPFVTVLDPGLQPNTLWVRGSNRAHIAYARDDRTSTIIALSVIDNLVKGAAGQAVQCMNVRFALDEDAGLGAAPLWP